MLEARIGFGELPEGVASSDDVKLSSASVSADLALVDGTSISFSGTWTATTDRFTYGNDGPNGGVVHTGGRCLTVNIHAHQKFRDGRMTGTFAGQAVQSYPRPDDSSAAIFNNRFRYIEAPHGGLGLTRGEELAGRGELVARPRRRRPFTPAAFAAEQVRFDVEDEGVLVVVPDDGRAVTADLLHRARQATHLARCARLGRSYEHEVAATELAHPHAGLYAHLAPMHSCSSTQPPDQSLERVSTLHAVLLIRLSGIAEDRDGGDGPAAD